MSDSLDYLVFACNVTASHLFDLLGPMLEAGMNSEEAWDTINDHLMDNPDAPIEDDCICLVSAEGDLIGWVASYDIGRNGPTVKYDTVPIQPNAIVADRDAFLKVAKRFAKQESARFLLVKGEGKPFGLIYRSSLLSPQMQLCLFCMVLELERAALRLFHTRAQESFDCLYPDRRKALREEHLKQAARRHPHAGNGRRPKDYEPSAAQLLNLTLVWDKKEILMKQGMFPELDPKLVAYVFNWAKEIRNDIAHPKPDFGPLAKGDRKRTPMTEDDVCKYVVDCCKLLRDIRSLT